MGGFGCCCDWLFRGFGCCCDWLFGGFGCCCDWLFGCCCDWLFGCCFCVRGLSRADLPSLLGADLAGSVEAFVGPWEQPALGLTLYFAADLLVVASGKACFAASLAIPVFDGFAGGVIRFVRSRGGQAKTKDGKYCQSRNHVESAVVTREQMKHFRLVPVIFRLSPTLVGL